MLQGKCLAEEPCRSAPTSQMFEKLTLNLTEKSPLRHMLAIYFNPKLTLTIRKCSDSNTTMRESLVLVQ